MKKRKILLLYPYYWPHYRAGGPVQSLYNLVHHFKEKAEFYMVSHDHDIDGSPSDEKVALKKWTRGPNGESIFFVRSISFILVYRIIRDIKPDVILINGIFNIDTTLPGIMWGKYFGIKIIISPRGMLQQWGLNRNKIVKKAFLSFLKLILSHREQWHATNEQEEREIHKIFGLTQNVSIASNIPRAIAQNHYERASIASPIKLVFLSLINPNKNLHLIIEAVSRLENFFTLDIYGPVINESYWLLCKEKIVDTKHILYKGPVPAWEVPNILTQYNYFVLPTQGENFGHAIFDALSCGVPVIISRHTPWKDLDMHRAGLYVEETVESIYQQLQAILELAPSTYTEYRENSLRYASTHLTANNYLADYKFLFDN